MDTMTLTYMQLPASQCLVVRALRHTYAKQHHVLLHPQSLVRSRAEHKLSRSMSASSKPCTIRMQACLDGSTPSTSGSNDSEHGEEESFEASMPLDMPRRSRQVTFTCNKCDGKTTRMVNPIAWDRGMVFVQCGTCEAWHNIRDAAGLIEEIRYNESSQSDGGE